VPAHHILRYAGDALTAYLGSTDVSERLKKVKDRVMDYLALRPVIFWRFAPYYVFAREIDAKRLFSFYLNDLTFMVHRLSLSAFRTTDKICGCRLITDQIDEWGIALCEGIGKGDWYGEGLAGVDTGYHQGEIQVKGEGAERKVTVKHVETTGMVCTRGRLLGLKYGLEAGWKAKCHTDENESLWLKCDLTAKDPEEVKALGAYLSSWFGYDTVGEKECRRLRERSLIIAKHASDKSREPNCVGAMETGPPYPYEPGYRVPYRNALRTAMKHFGLTEKPPVLRGSTVGSGPPLDIGAVAQRRAIMERI